MKLAKNYMRAKLLSLKLPILLFKITLILIAAIFLIVLFVGIVQMSVEGYYEESQNEEVEFKRNMVTGGNIKLSPEVEQYRESIKKEAESQGIGDYTNVLLALMMQESGGRGSDPMQASESLCGSIGCIDNVDLSITQGVKHFKTTMEKSNYDIKLGLQSYNFGYAFVSYVKERGGEYTKDLAISFSQMMYDKVKHTGIYRCHSAQAISTGACYGDINYVDSVLKYLPSASANEISGESESLGNINSPLSTKLIKTSNFGWRTHPILHTRKLHAGVDISCNTGESIHAVKDGIVVKSDTFGSIMLGEYIKIQHSATSYTTYGHMSRRVVSENEAVQAGQIIGACGSTGYSTAPHLHFETHSTLWGGYIDPAPLLGI